MTSSDMRSLLCPLLLGGLLPPVAALAQPPSLYEAPPPCENLVTLWWTRTYVGDGEYHGEGAGWAYHCEQLRLGQRSCQPGETYTVPPGFDLVIIRMLATLRTTGGEPRWAVIAVPPTGAAFSVVDRCITLPGPPWRGSGPMSGVLVNGTRLADVNVSWEVYDEIPFGRGMALPAGTTLRLQTGPSGLGGTLESLDCYGYLQPAAPD